MNPSNTGSGVGPAGQESATCHKTQLMCDIESAQEDLRTYLNGAEGKGVTRWLWLSRTFAGDPVRTKNLEKISGHLQNILSSDRICEIKDDDPATAPLASLLKQIDPPSELTGHNAWELSDLVEIESIRWMSDTSLYAALMSHIPCVSKLLNSLPGPGQPANQVSIPGWQATSHSFSNLDERKYAEALLRACLQKNLDEYRRDRAKVELRGMYLLRMVTMLLFLGGLFFIFYMLSTERANVRMLVYLVPVTLIAGAIGSLLSRAIRLGKQPLRVESAAGAADGSSANNTQAAEGEPPLGIRALMSTWSVAVVQPIIGAVTALIVYLVFATGLLQLGGIQNYDLNANHYALIGFLAGFSEPFFLNTLGGITDRLSARSA